MAAVVGAVEDEVAQGGELGLDPVRPRSVARQEDQLDVVRRGPRADDRVLVRGEVVQEDVELLAGPADAQGLERRTEGLPVGSLAGALSQERREQLEDIEPSWCPTWPAVWQRAFQLVRQHLQAGGELPQGEDLGRWVRSVQQWMCEHILGLQPAAEDEKPRPRRTQADTWAVNLAAARQYYQREGHLQVPRKHVEAIKLGAWISNQRSRAATLSPGRIEQLSAIGMRWERTRLLARLTVRIGVLQRTYSALIMREGLGVTSRVWPL